MAKLQQRSLRNINLWMLFSSYTTACSCAIWRSSFVASLTFLKSIIILFEWFPPSRRLQSIHCSRLFPAYSFETIILLSTWVAELRDDAIYISLYYSQLTNPNFYTTRATITSVLCCISKLYLLFQSTPTTFRFWCPKYTQSDIVIETIFSCGSGQMVCYYLSLQSQVLS